MVGVIISIWSVVGGSWSVVCGWWFCTTPLGQSQNELKNYANEYPVYVSSLSRSSKVQHKKGSKDYRTIEKRALKTDIF